MMMSLCVWDEFGCSSSLHLGLFRGTDTLTAKHVLIYHYCAGLTYCALGDWDKALEHFFLVIIFHFPIAICERS